MLIGITRLTLFSITPISNAILTSLENQHPSYLHHSAESAEQIKHIVILGGGHITDPAIPITSQINITTLARITEGGRLYLPQYQRVA